MPSWIAGEGWLGPGVKRTMAGGGRLGVIAGKRSGNALGSEGGKTAVLGDDRSPGEEVPSFGASGIPKAGTRFHVPAARSAAAVATGGSGVTLAVEPLLGDGVAAGSGPWSCTLAGGVGWLAGSCKLTRAAAPVVGGTAVGTPVVGGTAVGRGAWNGLLQGEAGCCDAAGASADCE